MSAIIYLLTNTVNGKQYVGQTRVGLEKRWKQHRYTARRGDQRHISRAIIKHGDHAFIYEVLENLVSATDDYINEREMYWIAKKQSNVDGYNMTEGGGGRCGYVVDKETRAKISNAHTGKTFTPEHRAKLSEAARNRTPEHRARIKEAAKNRTPETIAKMRESGKVKIFTDEHRANLSSALSGKNNPNYGKKHSPETIAKIRESKQNISPETRMRMRVAAKRRCRIKRIAAPQITIITTER